MKKKLAFFVKEGLDNFLVDVISGVSDEYDTRKIIVKSYDQINKWMQWADISFFEWCDELVIYASKLKMAEKKKIVCRLHRYEVFTDYPKMVNWDNVDRLIIVTEHLEKLLKIQVPDIDERVHIVTVNNGVNLSKYKFKERKKGFNIAYVGYIHARKNPVLLLQIMKVLVEKDRRYKLYVAGKFQDGLIELYWKDQINKMQLQDNVIFHGWQNDIGAFFEDKNYLLSTSIHESFGFGIAEAMARGIKPIIHNFLFADEIWDKKFMFCTLNEAVEMICEGEYNSKEYRAFIEVNYSLEDEIIKIKKVLEGLFDEKLTLPYILSMFEEFTPYTSEYINKFDFEKAYLTIGKREMIAQNIELVEFILKNEKGRQIVLTNILYNKNNKEIALPNYIFNSKHKGKIVEFVNGILNIKSENNKNIQGYVFDKEIEEDINKNYLAYMWERGIPATEFMPFLCFVRIIERYKFALKFIKPTDEILEAASGFGYGAAYFKDKCKKVYALDLSPRNIEFSKAAYDFENINFIEGDVTKLPFEDNKFDVYTSFETLEHLPIESIKAYFREAIRVLKKEGVMIISTPNGEVRKGINNPFHVKEYNYNEFSKMLSNYFSSVSYYSVTDFKVEKGMKDASLNMIAVCYI
ncbi:methyltransferase domain-containing protein [Clostridium felsineum]|uniref:2-methoxy-6-polyprenyl-1,4-benzoquinol methylase, mitochondrial n=1 Tax=Clostridium felsineum TaxID=36839 RepID=A0A1S8KYL0_9CLOT|nr:methyltransferase domain-containing protein [Clostridium felsineum]URZ07870.1 2-methoxy-6-polyprenyl-1,4-benzoquinol methylase, mitochondrial [Clostridium felsineum]URZ12901.1 2-methoxy-6-polyprenyl-1,4-benzoquinol methylase, mitochondrial [Clostridium felsineum]